MPCSKTKPDMRTAGAPAGIRTVTAGQLSSLGAHVARNQVQATSPLILH
jgi:hypothetical protein